MHKNIIVYALLLLIVLVSFAFKSSHYFRNGNVYADLTKQGYKKIYESGKIYVLHL